MPAIIFLAFFLSFLFPFTATFTAAAPLSFGKARTIMHERNESLKAASANVESAREQAESVKWLHGPTISAQAAEVWGRTRIDIDRSMPTPIGALPVRLEDDYDFSGPRAAISGTMPIFTGGKIPAVQKAAKYALEEAQAKQRNRSVDLDAELIGKYFGLQLAISVAKLRAATLAEEDRELARAIKFEQLGMISPVERMSAQVSRDAAERKKLKAADDERVVRLQLRRLMLDDSAHELTTPLFVLKKPLSPLKGWVDKALANNPQMAMMEARVRQADQGVELSKSSFFPQIFAFGEYSLIRHYQTMIEPTWMAGVGASLTLWDAKDRRATYKSARATLREARSLQAEVANQVRTAAETAWLNSQNAREQYNLTASTVTLARENLRLKSEGFGEGLYTALDVTDARDQLLKAEVGRRVAAFEFVVNYALLHAIVGDMDSFMKAYKSQNVFVEK